jgi:hypothetical protein
MNDCQGKGSYSQKTYPVPLCPPQIQHYFTRDRKRATEYSKFTIEHTKFFVRCEVFTAATMKMPSSEMLLCVVLVRTDVSEDRIASNSNVTRIDGVGSMLTVTNNRRTLRRNTILQEPKFWSIVSLPSKG